MEKERISYMVDLKYRSIIKNLASTFIQNGSHHHLRFMKDILHDDCRLVSG